MAACRKPWSEHVKLAGFSGFALPTAPEFRQHIAQICALREPHLDGCVECYAERQTGVEMRGVALVERYRSYAAKCVTISRNIPDHAGKLVLLEMAQSWLKLAEQAAEGRAPAVVYETAISVASQSD